MKHFFWLIVIVMVIFTIYSCKTTMYIDPHSCAPTSFAIIDSIPNENIGRLGKYVHYRKYYNNGILFIKGGYLNGERHGTWKMWNYEGELIMVKKYKKGREVDNMLILINGKW